MFVIVSRELLRWLNEHRVLGKPYTISLVERWLWEHSLAEGKVLWRLETSTDGPVGGAIERVSNADNETISFHQLVSHFPHPVSIPNKY